MKISIHLLFYLLWMLPPTTAAGQTRLQYSGISGNMLSHSPYNKNLDNRKSLGFQFSYLWNLAVDSSIYSKATPIKYVGISLYGMDMGDGFLNGSRELRKRLPAMGFGTGAMVITGIQRNFQHALRGSSISLQFGFGPILVSKYFDEIKNPTNQAIGSRLNFGSQLKLQVIKRISSHTSLALGTEMFHVSNTNFQKPNVGLNYLQGNASVFHTISRNNVADKEYYNQNGSIAKRSKFQLSSRVAFRRFRTDYPVNYAVMVVEADYGFQKRNKISIPSNSHQTSMMEWRVGLNYFHEMPRSVQNADGKLYTLDARSELGLYGRAVFRMGWIDVFLDLGYYVIPPQADRIKLLQKNKFIYNAIGSQYRISKNIFLIHRMKAHYQIADYLEMGLVYGL